jgi:hypothetical protein
MENILIILTGKYLQTLNSTKKKICQVTMNIIFYKIAEKLKEEGWDTNNLISAI